MDKFEVNEGDLETLKVFDAIEYGSAVAYTGNPDHEDIHHEATYLATHGIKLYLAKRRLNPELHSFLTEKLKAQEYFVKQFNGFEG